MCVHHLLSKIRCSCLLRSRLSASPATGLVGLKESGFLSDFFRCMGFLVLASERLVLPPACDHVPRRIPTGKPHLFFISRLGETGRTVEDDRNPFITGGNVRRQASNFSCGQRFQDLVTRFFLLAHCCCTDDRPS